MRGRGGAARWGGGMRGGGRGGEGGCAEPGMRKASRSRGDAESGLRGQQVPHLHACLGSNPEVSCLIACTLYDVACPCVNTKGFRV